MEHAKKPRKSVLLALGWYVHEINRGVAHYALEADWILDDTASHSGRLPPLWRGDGIVTLLPDDHDRALIDAMLGAGVPVVDLSDQMPWLPFARVLPDNRAIGRLGAEELIGRGLADLAFLVLDRTAPVVEERMRGFQATVEESGRRFHALDFSAQWEDPQTHHGFLASLGQALKRLPKPLGVMAQYDAEANYVVRACLDAGLAIPNEVAVIGADNDPIYSTLGPIPLSSVVTNREKLGYEGAALLDRLMSGASVPASPVRIAPGGIVVRRSSDVFQVADESVSRALNFIAQHLAEPFGVDDLARVAGVSRRGLYSKFRKNLGTSIHREIVRQRLNRARQMLLGSDDKIHNVAMACGFENGMKLAKAFQRCEGISPGSLRRGAVSESGARLRN